MSPAAHHLLRALYLHALAPSTANQDAVRAAGAALDTETARKLNAPRSPAPVDTVVAEVRADLLARSERGIAKYGVTLDRKDLGLREWMEHAYHEGLDRDLYLKRAIRELDAAAAASVEPPHTPGPDLAAIRAEARREALLDALAAVERVPLCYCGTALDYLSAVRDLFYRDYAVHRAAPVEPPHAAAPVLATLTPEPAEAVLGRAGEALAESRSDLASRAWQGALGKLVRETPSGEALAGSLPVYVLAGTGRHPYGDDAWHMETDGVARLFPSKEAAHRWLVAMGRAPA